MSVQIHYTETLLTGYGGAKLFNNSHSQSPPCVAFPPQASLLAQAACPSEAHTFFEIVAATSAAIWADHGLANSDATCW